MDKLPRTIMEEILPKISNLIQSSIGEGERFVLIEFLKFHRPTNTIFINTDRLYQAIYNFDKQGKHENALQCVEAIQTIRTLLAEFCYRYREYQFEEGELK